MKDKRELFNGAALVEVEVLQMVLVGPKQIVRAAVAESKMTEAASASSMEWYAAWLVASFGFSGHWFCHCFVIGF